MSDWRNLGIILENKVLVSTEQNAYQSRFKIRRAKNIPVAPFSVSFSQLPAVKKDTENGANGIFFGPSYFVTALPIYNKSELDRN